MDRLVLEHFWDGGCSNWSSDRIFTPPSMWDKAAPWWPRRAYMLPIRLIFSRQCSRGIDFGPTRAYLEADKEHAGHQDNVSSSLFAFISSWLHQKANSFHILLQSKSSIINSLIRSQRPQPSCLEPFMQTSQSHSCMSNSRLMMSSLQHQSIPEGRAEGAR
jgi:hypothetical protein